MQTLTFHAVKCFNNGLSRSKVITIEFEGSRSNAILATVEQRPDLHGHFLIDGDTKCNITFDGTVKMQRVEGKPFNSDFSCFTFSELEECANGFNSDPEVLTTVLQPFTRFHYNKSGRACDYLTMHGLIKLTDPSNPHDGGLFYDSALLHSHLKGSFIRNEFNEVVYAS